MNFTASQDQSSNSGRVFKLKPMTIESAAQMSEDFKRDENGEVNNWSVVFVKIAKRSIVGLEGFSSDVFSEQILIDTYGDAVKAMSVLREVGIYVMNESKGSPAETKNS